MSVFTKMELDKLSVMYDRDKGRDATSKIRGFLFQDYVTIMCLLKNQVEYVCSEYLEEGRFDKNGALKIFPTAKSAEVMILSSTDWKQFAQATGVQLSDVETMEGVAEVGRQYYEWTDSLTGTPNDGKAFWGREQWLIISLSAVNNWDWKSFLGAMGK